MFFNKIIEVIKNNNVDYILQNCKKDPLIIWHFLHNQKDDHNFLDIKNNLIDSTIKIEDQNIKFKFLEYLDKYGNEKHSYEVLEILSQLIQHNTNEILNRRIARSIEKLTITKTDGLLMSILTSLLQKTDVYTKVFTIESASKFIPYYNKSQISALVKQIFFDDTGYINRKKQKDTEVFRKAASFLGTVLQNSKHSKQFFEEAIKIYDHILKRYEISSAKKGNITNTYVLFLSNIGSKTIKERDFKYEDDIEKRLALELQYALETIHESKPALIPTLCDNIIKDGKYLVYFEILNRFLSNKVEIYPDIIEKLLFNKDLLERIDVLDSKRYNLYNKFLSSTSDSIISSFEEFIDNYQEENDKELLYTKASLAYIIPVLKRSGSTQSRIDSYEKEMSEEYNTDYKIETRDYNEVKRLPKKEFDNNQLVEKRTIQELKHIIQDYNIVEDNFTKNLRDFVKAFEDYITRHPDQLQDLYQEIKSIQCEDMQYILGGMTKGYLSHYETSNPANIYEHVLDLYDIFSDITNTNESTARMEIARFLERSNNYIRSGNTATLQEENPGLFTRIKSLIIKLANDPHPNYESSEDSVALNSVRGVAAPLLCVLAFYYPHDEDIIATIKILSNDKNIGIQAYLIQNLTYLIPDNKNYTLCKEIIDSKKDSENELIQQAIAKYMFRLGNKKIEENKDLLEKLCNSPYESVRESAGSLVGQALLHGVEIEDLFDKILKETIGDTDVLVQVVLAFQSHMVEILHERDKAKQDLDLGYFDRIINFKSNDKEKNNKVRPRIGYCFSDCEKFPNDGFDILHKKGILTKLVQLENQELQRELSEFFLYIIQKDQHIEEILDLLLEQSKRKDNNYSVMLSEERQAKEIIKILKTLYEKKDTLNKKVFEKAEQLFDEGLKYGLQGFYDILEKYYN